ncbi:hypothetical protein KGP36_06505 [Patescibacteria group bacterium]|nr:hypothetical protein [Patescibacteria group bacterium]
MKTICFDVYSHDEINAMPEKELRDRIINRLSDYRAVIYYFDDASSRALDLSMARLGASLKEKMK